MALRIHVKGSGTATHREETAKEVFDPYSRKHYEEKYKGMKSVLEGGKVPATMGGGAYNPIDAGAVQDVAQYRKDMNNSKRLYEKGHVLSLTPDVKNALWKKALELKRKISIGMVPQDELHPVKQAQVAVDGKLKTAVVADYGKINETRAMERNTAWYKRNANDLREFKRIIRVLEPNNEKATSVTENWRPKTRRKG